MESFNPLLEDFSWKTWRSCGRRDWCSGTFNPLLEDFSWKGTVDDIYRKTPLGSFNPLLEDFSWKHSAWCVFWAISGDSFQSSFRGFLLKDDPLVRGAGVHVPPFNPLLEDFSWKRWRRALLLCMRGLPFNPLLEDFSWKKLRKIVAANGTIKVFQSSFRGFLLKEAQEAVQVRQLRAELSILF